MKAQLEKDPNTAAAMRTTTAPTVINGGIKTNVLPKEASALVNFRVHPREGANDAFKRAVKTINNDRIDIEVINQRDPSPQSDHKSNSFKLIAETTAITYQDVAISPSLTIAGTDTRHYVDIADNNYRFSPFIFTPEHLISIHGVNEKISIKMMQDGAAWYEQFLRSLDGYED